MIRASKIAVGVALLMSFLIVSQPTACLFAVYGADDVPSEVDQADSAIAEALVAVAEAERAGANVSVLLVRLDDANVLLAEARNALRRGDYGDASLLAGQALGVVEGLLEEAGSLKLAAESDRQGRLVWMASLSGLGLVVLFVVSLLGWRLLRRRHIGQIMVMRPEKVNGN